VITCAPPARKRVCRLISEFRNIITRAVGFPAFGFWEIREYLLEALANALDHLEDDGLIELEVSYDTAEREGVEI